MKRKQVLFVADSLDNAHKFQQVLSRMDVDVSAGSSMQVKRLLSEAGACDLLILEVRAGATGELAAAEQLVADFSIPAFLAIVRDEMLPDMRMSMRTRSDFVLSSAGEAECAARIRMLLWPGNEASTADIVAVDSMTINLATYQVQVAGEPVDFTYLEYALLAFLVTHPGRTYGRDILLKRVWGFDYYGGSRTVDVHVRRVRAKLGPELAQHLETIRGVGYLWN